MSLATSDLDEDNKGAVFLTFHLSLSFVNKMFWNFPSFSNARQRQPGCLGPELLG